MRRSRLVVSLALGALVVTAAPGLAAPGPVKRTPMLSLASGAPAKSSIRPLINSGDTIGDFTFEGLPDGIGFAPGTKHTIDVFVNHEQSRVPFLGLADFVDSSVSRLTIRTSSGQILSASVAVPPSAGFIRFCSSFMAGPAQGFDRYVYLTNEESDDDLAVPAGAPYGPDPALAPNREAGYAIALDVATGVVRRRCGDGPDEPREHRRRAGRLGRGRGAHRRRHVRRAVVAALPVLGGDAGRPRRGRRNAARVPRHGDPGRLGRSGDPFNGANDYGDIVVGDDWQGEFIPVPDDVADGTTSLAPQAGLEQWSNGNNVFQFIRVEDITYDKNDPNVVYFADTGERRAIPDPTTGRLARGSSTTNGPYPNGRVFRMVLDPADPQHVLSFSILLDNDLGGYDNPDVMHQPDNVDTSANSLMVQEDTSQAPQSRIWRYDFATRTWSVVAAVLDPAWESSGIVDASSAFGPGAWLVDVQAHNVFVDQDTTTVPGLTLKREGGQLILLKLPGS